MTSSSSSDRQKQRIYQLLDQLFSELALAEFIATSFPEIFSHFAPAMDKQAKMQLLIEACAGQGQIARLIAAIRQARPAEYEAFARQAQASAKPLAVRAKPDLIYTPEQLLNRSLEERYRLDEILDKSGLGAVFKVYDTKLNHNVAIKLINLELVKQPAMQERVRQEVRTALRLDHPGVVKIYDFGQSGPLLYIVMAYISGQNLREARRRFEALQPLTALPIILGLVRQICLTIDYLHQHGILHPGTKPENIMLKPQSRDGEVWQTVLINLGLLRPSREMVLAQEEISPRRLTYSVSPELLLGHTTDPRSDVYMVGLILYDLVVGRPPFQTKDILEATRLHVEEPPVAPRALVPDLPVAVERIMLKALAKDPADRYLNPKGLAQALDDYLGSGPAVPALAAPEITMSLAEAQVQVTPGQQSGATLLLENIGSVADHCKLAVKGIPANWLSISPATTTVAPRERVKVELIFQPPAAPVSRAGRHAFTIQMSCERRPNQITELQRVLTVAPFSNFQSNLWPQEINSGQISQVTIENQGNIPERFEITAHAERTLQIEPDQVRLKVDPGQSQTVDFRVKMRRQRLIAEAKTQTFSLTVSQSRGRRQTLSGEVSSRGQLRPVWVLAAVVSVLFLLCLAGLFYPIIFPSTDTVQATAMAQQARADAATATVNAATAQVLASQTATVLAGAVAVAGTQQAAVHNATATAIWQGKDDDQDGLTNGEEVTLGTYPDNRDSDGDGLFDGDEVRRFNTNPFNPDTDYDGISDREEIRLNLDPLSRDTDLDRTPDSIDADPGRVPTPTATVTPNPIPSVRFSNTAYFAAEGEGQKSITVILDGASAGEMWVNYIVTGNTASPGSDFAPVSGTLRFASNQTVQSFVVPILNDNIREPEESLTLTLSNPQNGALGRDRQASLTIFDDDEPLTIQFSAATSLANLPRYETMEGQGRITIEVVLNPAVPQGQQVQVDYVTNNLSALAGEDYVEATGSLLFNPNDRQQRLTIELLNDRITEPDERFSITLRNSRGATINTPQAEVIVINDD
jgi:serine/threonine protein kinase